MGLLVDGHWQDQWYDTSKSGGSFERKASSFRSFVSSDADAVFPVENDRYHLYVAMACPWAHRTLIFRALKGLEAAIPITVVDPDMLDQGWQFSEASPDTLLGKSRMHEIYSLADPHYTGRVTVPVLWDKKANTIVNNESSELIRMLDGPLAELGRKDSILHNVSMYPADLAAQIDEINAVVYDTVNNGVYKAGFATTQGAYEQAVTALFDSLDMLEKRLENQAFLVGNTLTEADWRLLTTLLRFDSVYHQHFKCCRNRLRDFSNLWSYTRALYQVPGVAQTTDMAAIRRHYFYSHETINPYRIVPVAPVIDFDEVHDRRRFFDSGKMPWE